MPSISPVILLGKTIRQLARLRGGGSALPGLVLEKLQPSFLNDSLGTLPKGIVVITGTNGKTTTTKMVAELLRLNGLKVFTNPTGSNFTRGIVAGIIEQTDMDGTFDFDIAVIELDEAYARQFATKVKPDYVLALNVMRDQLDRFGEVDAAAKMLLPVLQAAKTCIINRDDPRLMRFAPDLTGKDRSIHYFGVANSLKSQFPSDDDLQSQPTTAKKAAKVQTGDVELIGIQDSEASYAFGKEVHTAKLAVSGIYNFQNGAAALATVKAVLGKDVTPETLVSQLAQVKPAFGRGEKLLVRDQPVELVLVKNPAGFRLSLQSFIRPGQQYMIAINDNYADGRDMSWLWDVSFSELSEHGVSVVSGVRAHDMALRLQYDEVLIGSVEPNISSALRHFLFTPEPTPKIIFCTYTAMLKVRTEMKKYAAEVERVL
jgi:UDP-N-acetylmuramyl tripeptide synthase